MSETLSAFIPLMVIQLMLAIFIYVITKKMKMNQALWTIFSLVPGVGLLIFYFLTFKIIVYMVDALNEILEKVNK
jgi:hypothetical protein